MPSDLVPPELVERFRSGDCVFFIGAGVSAESGLISGRDFKDTLIAKIAYPRRDVTLSKVAQAIEDSIDRPTLTDLVREKFSQKESNLQQSHNLIAQLAKQGYCTHIVTTNYDTLIEDALHASGCEFHLSKRDSEIGSAGRKKVHVLKFHGSVDDIETIVISEADYRGFFRKRPVLRNLLGGLLVEKTFIFLGYSLEDPDFDQIYHEITTSLGDFQRLSYAVQRKPDDFSDEQWSKFHVDPWTRRKIRIITANSSDFLTELSTKLKAPPPRAPDHLKSQQKLIWEVPQESSLGKAGQVQIVLVNSPPLQNCTVEIEFRMDADGGDSTQWFGVRVRGVTSYIYAGYLVYLRSNGYLDIVSVEERSILAKEVLTVDPKLDFVKLRISIIGERITVSVNDKLIIDEVNRLVTWPGQVFLHALGTEVTTKQAKLFDEGD